MTKKKSHVAYSKREIEAERRLREEEYEFAETEERLFREGLHKEVKLRVEDGDYDKAIATLIHALGDRLDDKLLSVVADLLGELVKPRSKKRGGQEKHRCKCFDEINAAYFYFIQSSMPGQRLFDDGPTNDEIVEKLKEYKVWVTPGRTGPVKDGAPKGYKTVGQTTVDNELTRIRAEREKAHSLLRAGAQEANLRIYQKINRRLAREANRK